MQQEDKNPLLENLDRTVFTFNMHNLTEMCFNHVVQDKTLHKSRTHTWLQSNAGLPKKMDQQIELCIKKYMETMKIAQIIQEQELKNQKSFLEKMKEDEQPDED